MIDFPLPLLGGIGRIVLRARARKRARPDSALKNPFGVGDKVNVDRRGKPFRGAENSPAREPADVSDHMRVEFGVAGSARPEPAAVNFAQVKAYETAVARMVELQLPPYVKIIASRVRRFARLYYIGGRRNIGGHFASVGQPPTVGKIQILAGIVKIIRIRIHLLGKSAGNGGKRNRRRNNAQKQINEFHKLPVIRVKFYSGYEHNSDMSINL